MHVYMHGYICIDTYSHLLVFFSILLPIHTLNSSVLLKKSWYLIKEFLHSSFCKDSLQRFFVKILIKITEFRENEHLHNSKFSNTYIFIKVFYAFNNVLWLSGYEKLFIKLLLSLFQAFGAESNILYGVFNFFFFF